MWILGLVLVAALAKLPEAVLPIGSDTGMFATYGRLLLHGATPYLAFWDVHPPLVYVYWALVEVFAGTDWVRTVALAHVLDGALSVAVAGIVGATARRLGSSNGVSAVAAVLTVGFANLSMFSQEGSTPTKLALLPSTLAVWSYIRASGDSRNSWRWALLAGAAGGAAMLSKQPAVLTLVALAGHATWLRARSRHNHLLPLLAGAATVIGVSLAYLGWIGAFGAFVDQVLTYNLQRVLLGYWHSADGLRAPAIRLDRIIREAAAALFIMAAIGAPGVAFKPERREQRILLWWTAASMVSIAGFREFEQIVPCFSILAAVGIGRIWQAAGRDGLDLGHPAVGRLALLGLLGTVLALSSGFQLAQVQRAWFERRPGSSPAHPEILALRLSQEVPAGPLFVWGNAAQLYALSSRDPASRFLNAEALRSTAPDYARHRAQLLTDLSTHPPAAIVLAPSDDSSELPVDQFPELNGLIRACYVAAPLEPDVARDWSLYVRSADLSSCWARIYTTSAYRTSRCRKAAENVSKPHSSAKRFRSHLQS